MRRGSAYDRGESLIELLVAVLIMGTAVVAVVGGLGTAIMMTDVHRKQAAVAAHLKIFAADLESAIAATPTTQYVNCATSASYPDYTPGPPYDADVTQVQYWNGSSFVASCASDLGVQRVRLRVWSTDGRADQSVDVIIRRPCRPTEAVCS
jgi:Tfp pilus assembly protein PilV